LKNPDHLLNRSKGIGNRTKIIITVDYVKERRWRVRPVRLRLDTVGTNRSRGKLGVVRNIGPALGAVRLLAATSAQATSARWNGLRLSSSGAPEHDPASQQGLHN
jgi:hypothetical protein